MKFSVPIFILKQQAKALSRREKLPLHQTLNQIAKREGFGSWDLLAQSWGAQEPAASLASRLQPGELVLMAARPGQGKTLLSLALAIEWMKRGNRVALFTLEATRADVAEYFDALNEDITRFKQLFTIDDSDGISAEHIIARLNTVPPNTLAIVDYLQLLDQKRDNPGLMLQVEQLRRFARRRSATVICLSQIHRAYDSAAKPFPALDDVRLPNPLDLKLFDKACFVNRGKVRIQNVARHILESRPLA